MNEPLETIARTIVVALAVGVAYSAVLAAFVAIVIRVTGASASTRHALWWLALAASAAIPLASVATSLARVEHHTIVATPSVAIPFAVTVEGVRFTVPTVPASIVGDKPTASTVAATDSSAASRRLVELALAYPHAGEVVVAILFCVAAGGWIALAASFAALRALKHASRPLDESVARRLRRFRHSARSGRAVELRVSPDVDVPVAVGFRTPTILLPTSLANADETPAATGDLDQIVLHEYAHLERYDDWTNALQLVLVRAFWFNPFVAFFAARIALEREIASDDWVVARTGRAHRYATCLWKLVEAVKLPTRRVVAPGALFSPRQIAVRIEQLLDSRRSALQRFSPFGASLTAIVAIALVVVAAVRAPAIAIDDAIAPVSTIAPDAPSARPVAPIRTLRPERSRLAPLAAPVAMPVVPHVALTPAPARARDEKTLVLHGVPVEATPEAIARAVATAVAASEHAVVETSVSRLATGPHSYADEIGIDVSHKVAVAIAPIGPAIARAVAMDTSRVIADATAGNAGPTAAAFLHGCQGCDLSGANLHGRNFGGVAWNMVDVHGANLSHANFRGANLTGVDFHGANLSGADFTSARISMGDLHGANLDGANLTNAHFSGSDLHGVSMQGTHLTGTSIDACDLHAADTRGAHISSSSD
jgi:beta-lactamase regulating signal transducer with metallopeptidase domain